MITCPDGLDKAGRSLWADLTETYTFSPAELRVLEDACRLRDRIERLRAVVDGPDFSFRAQGSMKQPIEAPEAKLLLAYEKQYQAAVKALNLPDQDGGEANGKIGSAAGRALALRRHRGTA